MKAWLIAECLAVTLAVESRAAPPAKVEDPLAGLAPYQRGYCDDPARRIVVTGARRSGKTEAVIAKLVASALKGGECVYISLTRKLAKRTVWKRLKARVRKLGIEYKVNESTITIDLPGGGSVELGGAADKDDIERYRGPAYALVVIDECGAQNPGLLKTLCTDVLRPALMDHEGQLVLAGTSGPTLDGYWFEMSNEQTRFSHPIYRWTIHHNPLFEGRVEEELQAVLDENEWDRANITFRREYYPGEWIQDKSVQVYPFDRAVNGIDSLPDRTSKGHRVSEEWRHVIAIDVGTTEKAMAIVVWASNRTLEDDYMVHAEAHTGMLSGQLAERIRALKVLYPGAQVVLDAGGMGKAHALELSDRFSIYIVPAEKTHKASAITIMRDRVLAGRVKVLSLASLDGIREEWSVLGWDDKHEQHNPNQADHYSDAALYGLRLLRNWTFDGERHKPSPRPDSPEAMAEMLEAEAMEEEGWIGIDIHGPRRRPRMRH